MKAEMKSQLQILETQVFALGILKTEHENHVAFAKLLEQDKQAVSDHQLAMSLHGLKIDHPDVKSCSEYEVSLCDTKACSADEQWEKAKEQYAAAFRHDLPSLKVTLHVDADEVDFENELEEANTDESEDGSAQVKSVSICNACLEVVLTEDTLALVCDHTYCRSCLTDHFKTALVDTGLFPPRCCKTAIPVETCRAILPKNLVKDFDLKVEELAHPNPTYCSTLDCTEFIRIKDIKNDIGTCVFCKAKTCVVCKGEEHEGLCPQDPHVVLLMAVAKRSKWQQCSRCKTMVELSQGCFHMT